jgi:3-oxoacyl-[acyl-carrier-protein] synthase-3
MTPRTAGHALGILGTGSYVPKEEISNAEVAQRTGSSTEWIERKTQIRSRRYAAPSEAASDLGAKAAKRALDSAGLTAEDVDYIIVSTGTGDSPQPPTACVLQDLLEARNAACFDINVACSGFVYGLEIARGLVTDQPDARVLVVCSEVYSRFADFSDPRTSVLLGDGAGAAVLGLVPAPYGVLATALASRGDAHSLIWIEAGGSRQPASEETVSAGGHFVKMHGRGVSEFVLEHVPPALSQLVADAGLSLDQVDHLVPHQPNGVLLGQLSEASGLKNARTHRTVERYANMGSASLAVTLDEAAGEFNDGDLVLLAGFGGGMAIGTAVLRWRAAA